MQGFHRIGNPVAAKEHSRSDLINGRHEYHRLCRRPHPVWLFRRTATQPPHREWRLVGFRKDGKTSRYTIENLFVGLRKLFSDLSRPLISIVDDQASIDHEEYTHGGTALRLLIGFERQVKNRDVDCRGLAG